jgi:DNA-binding Lrp family transcriptional regulator
MTRSAALDDVDRRIVAALQSDPRASWSKLSGIVRVSETTVLRRVNRMRDDGLLVVTAAPDPLRCGLGQPVHIFLRTAAGKAPEVANTLAQRQDVRYVSLLTGTRDVMCELIAPDRHRLGEVVLHELAAAGPVQDTTTAVVLKQFKTEDQWSSLLLDADPPPVDGAKVFEPGARTGSLDDVDTRRIDAMRDDGRRSYADLSQDLGLSETAVARRIAALRADERIDFLAMVDPSALGFELEVIMHVRIEPGRIEATAKAFAATRAVRYVSVTTGISDLTCDAVFRDSDDLYEFITHTVGEMRGVIDLDVDLVLQSVKRGYHYPLFAGRPTA